MANLKYYLQIADLQDILKSTEVSIPRLRGLQLMVDENIYEKKQIERLIQEETARAVQDLIQSKWHTDAYEISSNTENVCKYYLTYKEEDGYSYPNGIRWDRLHGKKRKLAKFAVKQARKKVINYTTTFNKYTGCTDVLRVYTRIGGWNWEYYGGIELSKHPAFLEKVDDYFDSTYCNIFLKIDSKLVKEYLENKRKGVLK